MNVTTLWYWAQNAAKTKKAVDVIVVGASGTIVKTTVQPKCLQKFRFCNII